MTINSTVYVFGNLGGGYTQHPDDYAREIFQNFAAKATANSQITIHRHGSLMYYGYIRKLDAEGRFIGFCVLLNGAMFKNVGELFSIFENAVADMTARGTIIGFNELGSIVPKVNGLYQKPNEVARIAASISRDIAELSGNMAKLPPVSYSVSNSESKSFSIKDSNDNEIAEASAKFAFTFVFKDNGYNTDALNGYKDIITKLHKEKVEISRQYAKLRNDFDKLSHQKKQYRNIIILCVVVLCMGIGGYFLYSTLTHTERILAEANTTISHKNDTIGNLSSQNDTLLWNINDLRSELSAESTKREEAEDALKRTNDMIKSRQPLFIKDTNFRFSTGWLDIDYFGIEEKNFTLTIIVFYSDYYGRTAAMGVKKGNNTFSVYLGTGLASDKWYNFAIFDGNTLIGGGRH